MAARNRDGVNDLGGAGGTKSGTDIAPDLNQVAEQAYERFLARGQEHGRDQEDWFEAEREARDRAASALGQPLE